jgi:DNA-binding MarR family transcriptional regulator
MAALSSLDRDAEVDFAFLRETLALSDGNLGAHLEKLESVGYVSIKKTFVGKKPRTLAKLTKSGRRAFEDYIEAMKAIIGASDSTMSRT